MTTTSYDVIIRGGAVVDGTGAPRRRVDVGVVGDRIAAIDDLSESDAEVVIDATGRVVAPGLTDVHTHLDAQAVAATSCSARAASS
jgi:N-acyl-D-amino-acid deacylase